MGWWLILQRWSYLLCSTVPHSVQVFHSAGKSYRRTTYGMFMYQGCCLTFVRDIQNVELSWLPVLAFNAVCALPPFGFECKWTSVVATNGARIRKEGKSSNLLAVRMIYLSKPSLECETWKDYLLAKAGPLGTTHVASEMSALMHMCLEEHEESNYVGYWHQIFALFGS